MTPIFLAKHTKPLEPDPSKSLPKLSQQNSTPSCLKETQLDHLKLRRKQYPDTRVFEFFFKRFCLLFFFYRNCRDNFVAGATGLRLDLVFNPPGPFLPPKQCSLLGTKKKLGGGFKHLLFFTPIWGRFPF